MLKSARLLLVFVVMLASLPGCSDNNNSGVTANYSVDPKSIDVSNASYCDILQPAKCLFPFPNNFFTRADASSKTGIRLNYAPQAMPTNSTGDSIDVSEYNRNDGFSPGPLMLAHVPGIDLQQTGAAALTDIARSLDSNAPVQLIHADSGERQLIWAELDAHPAAGEDRALMIQVGRNLREGERYIVVLQNLRRQDGSTIPPVDAFKVYLEAIPSDVPELESRRTAIENILTTLSRHGVRRSSLYLAWDFTVASTENITGRAIHMRDEALNRLAGAGPTVTITEVQNFAPAASASIGRIVRGTFSASNFLNRVDAGPGSRLNYESDAVDALPMPLRAAPFVQVPFVCAIPHVALTDAADGDSDTRAVVIGHGLFGNRDAALSIAPMAQEQNLLSCAVDWWGMSNADIPVTFGLLGNMALFPSLPDRLQQAFVNQILLSEAIVNPAGFATLTAFQTADGHALFRAGEVHYDGLSQGAVLGGALSALNPNFKRAVLNVAGMNFSLLIRRSNAWKQFSIPFDPAYTNSLDKPLIFALVQGLWDRAETNGYANHITRDPLPGSAVTHILLHAAIGDQTVTETATEVLARTLGLKRHSPTIVAGRHIAVEPYVGIDASTAYPTSENLLVMWDSGPFPIAGHAGTPLQRTDNLPTNDGYNTHGMTFNQRAARDQKAAFWRSGHIINVCGQLPCFGDGYDGTPGVFE